MSLSSVEPCAFSGKLAVLDYGIGGLDVWRQLRARHPQLDMIYLSDSGFTPYGQLSRRALCDRLITLMNHLRHRGAGAVVIACNAASSALAGSPPDVLPLPTLGIIESGLEEVRVSGARRVGVIGGGRTISSRVYGATLSAEGFEVIEQVAQPLSISIEAGDLSSDQLCAELADICAPLQDREVLLLACTHYPAIAPLIQRALPSVKLLDPAPRFTREISSRWRLTDSSGEGGSEIFTTGAPSEMIRAAWLGFSIKLAEVSPFGSITP